MTNPGPTVAFDVGPLAGPITGVGVAVAGMRDALVARPDGPHLLPYRLSIRAPAEPGVRRLPLPAAAALRLWERGAWPRVDRWLDGAAVVHGTNYTVPPAKVPRVVSVYDCWFLQPGATVHPDVALAGRVLRRVVADGAVVHVSSHATGRAVRELLGTGRVAVIPLGPPPLRPVDPAAQPPHPELVRRPFVLALGTVERRKNLPRLVRAFGQLATTHPDVMLVIAGAPGDDQGALERAVAELTPAVGRRVLVTGRVDDATKAWLLHHATVLAYPSLDEGFGFPLLEAFAAGAAVVASRAGSIPEVAGPAAALVPPADVDELAGAISHLLGDEAARAELVAAGRDRLRVFDWATTAAALARLYHSLAMDEDPA
jgi:glycosyltransferase involved in cell wall biosynthesis